MWSDWVTTSYLFNVYDAEDEEKSFYEPEIDMHVNFRKTTDSSQLDEANKRIKQAFISDNFSAKELTIITWTDVEHYRDFFNVKVTFSLEES